MSQQFLFLDCAENDDITKEVGWTALLRALLHRQQDPNAFHDLKIEGLRLKQVPTALLSEFGVPQEFVERPIPDVLHYLRSLSKTPARDVYRAKIIVLGDGGAGKSSLIKRLLHNEFVEGLVMTDGIDVGTLLDAAQSHCRVDCLNSHDPQNRGTYKTIPTRLKQGKVPRHPIPS